MLPPALARLAKRQVRWWLVRFLYRITDILGKTQRMYRAPPSKAPGQDRIRRILVIRLDLLGDLVMTLPAIAALRARWPEAAIAVLCTPGARPIALRCPDIDEVFTYDPNVVRAPRWWTRPSSYLELFAFLERLRRRRFDLALSMSGEFACLFAWASGARHRVGYAQEGYPALLTTAAPGRRYQQPLGHEVQWNELLAATAGAPGIGAIPRLQPEVAPEDAAWLDDLLGDEGQTYVVISPGAHNGSAKRYLLESWATVANALARTEGVRIVLSGTRQEVPLVERLAALLDVPPIVTAGQTDVPRLLTLLSRARLLLAGDSGPVHLAAALGTPVVVAFGPTDPQTYRPFTDRATVLKTDLPCSPCYDLRTTAECRLGYKIPLCMALLPAARVLAAAQHWLDRPEGSSCPQTAGSLNEVLDLVVPVPTG